MEVISTLNEYEGSSWGQSLYSSGLLLTINHPQLQIQSTAEPLTHKRQRVVGMWISSILGLGTWAVRNAGRILGERGSVNSAEFYYPDRDILPPAGPLLSSLSLSLYLSPHPQRWSIMQRRWSSVPCRWITQRSWPAQPHAPTYRKPLLTWEIFISCLLLPQ